VTPGGSIGASYFTLTPCRIADTRNPAGPSGGPALSVATPRNFPIAGICGVSATAKAVSVNVTAVQPTQPGFVTLYPAGQAIAPLASTINFRSGIIRANNAVVRLGAGGAITALYGAGSAGTTHFIIDVTGYFE
jgi:hypothetical protein